MQPIDPTLDDRYCPKCDAVVRVEEYRCPRCGLNRPDRGWPIDVFVGMVVAEKYRILERIGRGGMGSVYLAEHVYEGTSLGRVAIKFLQPKGTMQEQEFLKRKFISEAGFSRMFDSPHIIKVYDFGTHDGHTYMAMEFLKGESLEDRLLRKTTLKVPVAVDIALQIAEAIAEVHRHDVIHRDIKPDNILLMEEKGKDFVKILDFGIAKRIDPSGTKLSTQVGTPRYMPPEQLRGDPIDARADIYALGILLWECLAGDTPTDPTGIGQTYAEERMSGPAPDIAHDRAGLPEDLRALVNAMVHPMVSRRPQSVNEVVTALEEIKSTIEPTPDPVRRSGADEIPVHELKGRSDDPDATQTYPATGSSAPVERLTLDRAARPHGTPPPVSHTAMPTRVRSKRLGPGFRILGIVVVLLSLAALADWAYMHWFRGPEPRPPSWWPGSGSTERGPLPDPVETEDASVDGEDEGDDEGEEGGDQASGSGQGSSHSGTSGSTSTSSSGPVTSRVRERGSRSPTAEP